MQIWHLHSEQPLRWEHWRDQSALYQIASGETHFLNPLGVAILMQLEFNSADLNQLCNHIAMEFDCLIDDDLRSQIATSLTRFDELGLIRCQYDAELAT
ncbi:hypothetical protein CKO09_03150 [Chromatium weissei]|nr:hypothetical protein [Chromatium weissei]